MNDKSSSSFQPLHNAHAIEQVAIGAAFDQLIEDEALKSVKEAIGNPPNLPGRAELRGLSIPITQGGPGIPVSAPVAGYGFTKTREDGLVETELVVHRNAITFRTRSYLRWANLWEEAKQHFELLMPFYLRTTRVMQLSLNYLDKFVSSAPLAQCKPTEILQTGSPYLAPHVFSANDLWHSHTGFFQRVDARTKQLVTVNVDFIVETTDKGARPAVSIASVLSHMFNQAEYEPFAPSPSELSSVLDRHFGALHDLDKEVLGSIITRDIARRIALDS